MIRVCARAPRREEKSEERALSSFLKNLEESNREIPETWRRELPGEGVNPREELYLLRERIIYHGRRVSTSSLV